MNSLKQNCFNQIQTQNGMSPAEFLPHSLYDEYIENLQLQSFPEWKQKIQVVNLELNIADMDVNQDMFLDEITHHIYIKKKIKDEEESDDRMDVDMNGEDEDEEEFELYHEFHDETGLYPAYYQIARAQQYIE